MPSLWGWQTAVSIIITLGILIFLSTRIDFRALMRDVSSCNFVFVLIGALCHYATYPVRGLRWRYSLGMKTANIRLGKFGLVVFFYNFIDNLVPGKLGDLYAAHMARINFGVRRSAALGSIFFLRMIDAWIVLLLAALSSWGVFSSSIPKAVVWGLAGGLVLAVTITVILIFFLVLHNFMPKWMPKTIREMILAFRVQMWPARSDIPAIAFLTGIIWILETLWIYFLIKAFGINISTVGIIFLAQVPLLSSAFPLTPSGAGVVEATLYGCLRLLSVSHPLAVSVTVVNRFFDYWLHLILGAITWMLRRQMNLRTWREGIESAGSDSKVLEDQPLVKSSEV